MLSDLLLKIHAGLGIVFQLGKSLALDFPSVALETSCMQEICFGILRIVSIVEYIIGEEFVWNIDGFSSSLADFCSTCLQHIF